MRHLLLFCTLFLSALTVAQPSELSITMKNMGHAYKKAVQAPDSETLIVQLDEVLGYLKESKKAYYKPELKNDSIKGLEEVEALVKQAKTLAQANNLAESKKLLVKVDSLRKQYHKLHEPPSFWQLLFG